MKEVLSSPKNWIVIIFLLIVILYASFQARFIIFGPQVSIVSHQDGEVVDHSVIDLSGQAKNISWISLNDYQIFTDEEGFWSERLAVSKGMNIMTVKVRDRLGREKEKMVRIILN
jgi:hypothetical protein